MIHKLSIFFDIVRQYFCASVFPVERTDLSRYIVGTPSTLLKWGRGGRTFQELSHLKGGGTKVFARKGDRKGVDVEMGVCHFFITLQPKHIYCVCGESKFSFITFQIFIPFG